MKPISNNKKIENNKFFKNKTNEENIYSNLPNVKLQ